MARPTRVVDLLNPASMLLPAANVIMQLSAPGVGYGVLESPVDRGNVYKHPFKRARTTGTYLAAATMGTAADRTLIRKAVNGAHAQVRSTASSPVSYHAFDPALQHDVADDVVQECESSRGDKAQPNRRESGISCRLDLLDRMCANHREVRQAERGQRGRPGRGPCSVHLSRWRGHRMRRTRHRSRTSILPTPAS